MTFDYFFYQYLAVAFEIFIVTTLVVGAFPQAPGQGFWEAHSYNLCFLAYQVGLVSMQFTTRCFLVRLLPLFPATQFLMFLIVGYMSLQGASHQSECSRSPPSR